MNEVKEWKVLTGTNLTELETKVNEAIAEGYQPVEDSLICFQGMVHKEVVKFGKYEAPAEETAEDTGDVAEVVEETPDLPLEEEAEAEVADEAKEK